ncbi:DNA/RNA non-specific endonuclease [Salmonella enterica subsp. enterica serovar Enteritidis str. 642046 4-7]|nr:DNA/RNA non-specific endonuclease [Salmonella enterica subsp. enterica serovar Enteritidis str. 642046 4-7]SUG83078.1 DNA/RNA non-specific endonuclease [Salmonella enterica subsp. enterica]
MFFGINMNITLYSFELIFYDVFDVYLLLIFTVIVLSLMMSASNGW